MGLEWVWGLLQPGFVKWAPTLLHKTTLTTVRPVTMAVSAFSFVKTFRSVFKIFRHTSLSSCWQRCQCYVNVNVNVQWVTEYSVKSHCRTCVYLWNSWCLLFVSPGQNATGQNATNSGICFSFLRFSLAYTQCSSKLREEKKNRIEYYFIILFEIQNTNTLFIETRTRVKQLNESSKWMLSNR